MKKVSFHDQVLVWNHPTTLGDNPSCICGTPVALDNVRDEDSSAMSNPLRVNLKDMTDEQDKRYAQVMVDRKRLRQKQQRTAQGPPCSKLNYFQRQQRLQSSGHSMEEIKQTEKTTRKFRHQREWTNRLAIVQLPHYVVYQEIQAITRPLRKTSHKKWNKQKQQNI